MRAPGDIFAFAFMIGMFSALLLAGKVADSLGDWILIVLVSVMTNAVLVVVAAVVATIGANDDNAPWR